MFRLDLIFFEGVDFFVSATSMHFLLGFGTRSDFRGVLVVQVPAHRSAGDGVGGTFFVGVATGVHDFLGRFFEDDDFDFDFLGDFPEQLHVLQCFFLEGGDGDEDEELDDEQREAGRFFNFFFFFLEEEEGLLQGRHFFKASINGLNAAWTAFSICS